MKLFFRIKPPDLLNFSIAEKRGPANKKCRRAMLRDLGVLIWSTPQRGGRDIAPLARATGASPRGSAAATGPATLVPRAALVRAAAPACSPIGAKVRSERPGLCPGPAEAVGPRPHSIRVVGSIGEAGKANPLNGFAEMIRKSRAALNGVWGLWTVRIRL